MKRSRKDSEAVRQRKRKRRKDRQEGGDSDTDGLRLLKYAALGEARKVAKVAKRKHVNIDVMDVEGSTPLHQVTQRVAGLGFRGAWLPTLHRRHICAPALRRPADTDTCPSWRCF